LIGNPYFQGLGRPVSRILLWRLWCIRVPGYVGECPADADFRRDPRRGVSPCNPGRIGQRNGYRQRSWDTKVGTVELSVPRVRDSSYFPLAFKSCPADGRSHDPHRLRPTRRKECPRAVASSGRRFQGSLSELMEKAEEDVLAYAIFRLSTGRRSGRTIRWSDSTRRSRGGQRWSGSSLTRRR
jgi:mutator family transposase